jgi:hypothetical protein
MTARHTFSMDDEYDEENPHTTHIEMTFEADQLDELVDEFLHYLWHCGFTYVEGLEVHKKTVT